MSITRSPSFLKENSPVDTMSTSVSSTFFAAPPNNSSVEPVDLEAATKAYTEVSNQLSAIRNLDQSVSLQTQRVERLEKAIDTSLTLFASARADYLEVLTTRQELLEAQLELIESKQAQLRARVELYQALGGGWGGAT